MPLTLWMGVLMEAQTQTDLLKKDHFKKEIDFEKPDTLTAFGSGLQAKVSLNSEEVLKQVRNKDAAGTGTLLTQVMSTLKEADLDDLADPGVLKRLWGRVLEEFSLYRSSFQKINSQLDYMALKLESDKRILSEEIECFRAIYEQSLKYYHELNLMIGAADERLIEKAQELKERERKLEGSPDYIEVQKFRDERSALEQFQKRVHDLRLTRTMVLQTLPQIRILQQNNIELLKKIQTAILNTLPVWKNQIVLAVGLQKQKKVAGIQKKTHKTTNELLLKNSALLKEHSLEVARLSESSSSQSETLNKVNEDLMSTVTEVLQIYREGRDKRKQAERELLGMEKRLVGVLSHIAD